MLSFQQLLPKTFLWFIPLYVGVELVLGLTILNKISGFYGMLSLFTGHPLDFCQCVYYFSCIIITPFYLTMLRNLQIASPSSNLKFKNSTVNKVSFTTLLYCADTVCSLLFTLYFSWFWFSGAAELQDSDISNNVANNMGLKEDQDSSGGRYVIDEKRDVGSNSYYANNKVDTIGHSSESASMSYEMFITVSSILVVSVVRVYFTLILLSFTKTLIKAAKYNSVNQDHEDDENMNTDFLKKSFIKRKLRQAEIISGAYLRQFFA